MNRFNRFSFGFLFGIACILGTDLSAMEPFRSLPPDPVRPVVAIPEDRLTVIADESWLIGFLSNNKFCNGILREIINGETRENIARINRLFAEHRNLLSQHDVHIVFTFVGAINQELQRCNPIELSRKLCLSQDELATLREKMFQVDIRMCG
jgi:hypothetical protein